MTSKVQPPAGPTDLFDQWEALREHTEAAQVIIEKALHLAPQERRVPSPKSGGDTGPGALLVDSPARRESPVVTSSVAPAVPATGRLSGFDAMVAVFGGVTDVMRGNAAPAAPNANLGPRIPCRICGDKSLYGIHPACERIEIENERSAMDREYDDEGACGAGDEE